MLIAIRPADKAAQNDYDSKRYKTLMAKSVDMTDSELANALEETRAGDVPEIESLREVAYNDVALELNRPDATLPLSTSQKILQIIA